MPNLLTRRQVDHYPVQHCLVPIRVAPKHDELVHTTLSDIVEQFYTGALPLEKFVYAALCFKFFDQLKPHSKTLSVAKALTDTGFLVLGRQLFVYAIAALNNVVKPTTTTASLFITVRV